MLRILSEQHPDDTLTLIIGTDSLLDLPQWYQPERLNDYAEIAAIARSGHRPDLAALAQQHPAIYRQVRVLNLPLIELSGRLIRARVADGKSLRYMTTSAVEAYIHDHALYQ
jgi:nicotinate-nucleotide adenylyltransferase